MSTIDNVAFFFGYGLITIFAIAVVAICVYLLAGFIGREVFTRMQRVYHLTSIWYWLSHYEKRGRKCFLTPDEGDIKDENAGL